MRGLVRFMAASLAFAACVNFWVAIYQIARSASYTATPHYVFGNLRAWGFVTWSSRSASSPWPLGVVAGSQRARWFGAGLALVNGFGQISGLPGYPPWFLVVTAVDMVVLFGLAIYGRRSAVQERKLA